MAKHAHDPNPAPPSADPTFHLSRPGTPPISISLANLLALPLTTFGDCYIISTGHGISGPFTFGGVSLSHFIQHNAPGNWSKVEVMSGDGFATEVAANEFGETLLAHTLDGRPLTRQKGLVRLIVPRESDDALRQVKWVSQITLLL